VAKYYTIKRVVELFPLKWILLAFLSVYIYGIAHGLKGIERNTDGQGYILELEIAVKELVEVLNEEIGILEVAQHSQIRHHT